MTPSATVLVPGERAVRWVQNFETRHGATSLEVSDGALTGLAADGSTFVARLPFTWDYHGPADAAVFAAGIQAPHVWGVLLVRKGGFAIARIEEGRLGEHKIGQRHVQGRTKAGGQSQQRFARRRDNQARQAYEAAADHAARILGGRHLSAVTGGDHGAVAEVLTDPRLRELVVVPPWLDVPDPRRAVLDAAVVDGASAVIEVVNA